MFSRIRFNSHYLKWTLYQIKAKSDFYNLLLKQKYARNYSNNVNQKQTLLPFEAKTDVTKDVMIYSYENPKFFYVVSLFGLTQFAFWLYLSTFTFKNVKDVSHSVEAEQIKNKKDNNPKAVLFWEWMDFSENKYRYTISTLFAGLGYTVVMGTFLFTLRSVRYIVLLKGGKFVRIITYSPVGSRRITVPLNRTSGQHSLQSKRSYYSFKVKGYWFYFLLDSRGKFPERKLFENTIGISRNLK